MTFPLMQSILDFLPAKDIRTLQCVIPTNPDIQVAAKCVPWEKFFGHITKARIWGLPVLNIGDAYGQTGYIDFIRPDMMSHRVMRGIDHYGRAFISIRFKQFAHTDVLTLFQRFSTDPMFWVTNSTSLRGFEGVCIVRSALLALVSRILAKSELTYSYEDQTSDLVTYNTISVS